MVDFDDFVVAVEVCYYEAERVAFVESYPDADVVIYYPVAWMDDSS